ncbi:MAG: MerR family transcriptional regulator [Myxococcales bacterium]|nr:MerR family transcriptional regulator [Myxococcales bacterium]
MDAPKTTQGPMLTTGDMARLGNTTLRTVRFYESEGLIEAADRTGGSHRKFAESELRKLQIISDLRDAGLSLQEIKDLIALKSGAQDAASAAGRLSRSVARQVAEIDGRIAALQRVRAELGNFSVMLDKCEGCEDPRYPERCRDCDVVNESGADRATELLWKD